MVGSLTEEGDPFPIPHSQTMTLQYTPGHSISCYRIDGALVLGHPPPHESGAPTTTMDLTASERLTDLEDKMVRALDKEWDRWEESTGPLPTALVMLMEKAHRAIFSRVGKSAGMDLNEMMRNPEGALVELDKRKALILKLLEQKNSGQRTGSTGAIVFPFPVAVPTPKEP